MSPVGRGVGEMTVGEAVTVGLQVAVAEGVEEGEKGVAVPGSAKASVGRVSSVGEGLGGRVGVALGIAIARVARAEEAPARRGLERWHPAAQGRASNIASASETALVRRSTPATSSSGS